MSLYEVFYEPCVNMIRMARKPDAQGGYTAEWQTGKAFNAAITGKKTAVSSSAEKSAVDETFTVTTPRGTRLTFGAVFRRQSDGAVFRVTSNYSDTSPPKCAGFSFEQVTAERWELT